MYVKPCNCAKCKAFFVLTLIPFSSLFVNPIKQSIIREMKGSVEALRNSADVAVLLVDSFDSCGVGFVYGIAADMAVSVVQKSCAVG